MLKDCVDEGLGCFRTVLMDCVDEGLGCFRTVLMKDWVTEGLAMLED